MVCLRDSTEMSASASGPQKIRRRERGAVLVLALIIIGFLSVLGVTLVAMANGFLQEAVLKGDESRSAVLAAGAVGVGLVQFKSTPVGGVSQVITQGEVLYLDGTKGGYRVTLNRKELQVVGEAMVNEVTSRSLARFEGK